MGKFWLVAAALSLIGCANQGGQTAAPLVPSQLREGAGMPPAWGVTQVAVRAYVTEVGATREASGAACELASPYSTASFTAPATVSVPDLGPQTPVLRISCSDGARRGVADVQAALRSTNGGLAGWPAIGVSVGTGGYSGVSVGGFWGGGWGTSGPNVQQAVYPDAQVMMR